MRIDNIISFDQVDADEYVLAVDAERKGIVDIHMHSFEAIRLYNLVVKQLVGFVNEMNIAKAAYERGDGPNGEPAGTWGPQSLDAYRCVDPEGDWAEMMREQADLQRKALKENR